MPIIIADNLVRQLLAASTVSGSLYGWRLDDGDVLRVQGFALSAGEYLGRWERGRIRHDVAQNARLADGDLLLLLGDEAEPLLSAFVQQSGRLQPHECKVVSLYADYTARQQGLFETRRLAESCVAVIGLGSGGSQVAVQLAGCGLGRIRLVDFDRLDVQNIARHVCRLHDIGRYKTRALRDLLLERSPFIQVEIFEANILDRPELLQQIVSGCDLVVVATDSEPSKLKVNQVCWPRKIPAVYGAAYNRAFGGDVFRALPPDDACYACFNAAVGEFYGTPPTAASDFSPGYADPTRMADLIAEPGLGMDVGVIALLLAQVALRTLLHGSETTLSDFPTNWLLFGNRAEWIFEQPLERLFVAVPRRDDCPVCNYETYVRRQLGMTPQQAAAAAQDILALTPNIDSGSLEDC